MRRKILFDRIKSEKRSSKKKKRRYPVSGRGVFIIQKLRSKKT